MHVHALPPASPRSIQKKPIITVRQRTSSSRPQSGYTAESRGHAGKYTLRALGVSQLTSLTEPARGLLKQDCAEQGRPIVAFAKAPDVSPTSVLHPRALKQPRIMASSLASRNIGALQRRQLTARPSAARPRALTSISAQAGRVYKVTFKFPKQVGKRC